MGGKWYSNLLRAAQTKPCGAVCRHVCRKVQVAGTRAAECAVRKINTRYVEEAMRVTACEEWRQHITTKIRRVAGNRGVS